eukprot:TRINITY_DN5834_c0_g1_i1.p1 TRINITY_DN5834_c0_g1~~TRINITY_DN5834_c0_g1_i1.p1  ORF type:complete len:427 (+),score=98.48 TRINITY_DN5834_c0_g1_i1:81-1361(+)
MNGCGQMPGANMVGMPGMPAGGCMGAPMGMGMAPMGMPMMAPMGMAPMGMPMMGMPMMPNPMMMMMAGAMAAAKGGADDDDDSSTEPVKDKGSAPSAEAPKATKAPGEMDADVRKLGDHFNIEDRWLERLDELMSRRQDTKEQDLAKLYEVLEQARSPTGLLVAKLGEMECGQFVGKVKPDRNIERLATRYKLDTRVVSRLTELRVRRKKSATEDFNRLEQHLSLCKRPSATATLLIGKILEGELRQVPDVTTAKALAQKFKLDRDAKNKLREIAEKRADDVEEVMQHLERTLQMSHQPSATLCKLAKTLMDGGKKKSEEDKYAKDSESDRDASPGHDRERSKSGQRSESTDSSSMRRRRAALGRRSRSRSQKGKKKKKKEKAPQAASQASVPSVPSAPRPGAGAVTRPGGVQVGSGSGGWTVTEW